MDNLINSGRRCAALLTILGDVVALHTRRALQARGTAIDRHALDHIATTLQGVLAELRAPQDEGDAWAAIDRQIEFLIRETGPI